MTRQENVKLVNQLKEICTFLPTVSGDAEFTGLRLIYERGGKHMLESENLQRLVDTAHEHVRELRKIARLFVAECRLNLAQHAPPGQK